MYKQAIIDMINKIRNEETLKRIYIFVSKTYLRED